MPITRLLASHILVTARVKVTSQFQLDALAPKTLIHQLYLHMCICILRRNDLLGLEGMVKLKNPDEVIVVSSNNSNANTNAATNSNSLVHNSESQAELNASTVSNADSEKRWVACCSQFPCKSYSIAIH